MALWEALQECSQTSGEEAATMGQPPPLKLIHLRTLPESRRYRQSLAYWRNQQTDSIVQSLRLGLKTH